MQNNNDLTIHPFLRGLLADHTEQTIQSAYTRNVWLAYLPPELHAKLNLHQCESDEDMLMRNYLYAAKKWLPFVVGHSLAECKHELTTKLNSIPQNEADVQQWKSAVNEVLVHMEECYKNGSLTKLKKLSKDWRVSVFADATAIAA